MSEVALKAGSLPTAAEYGVTADQQTILGNGTTLDPLRAPGGGGAPLVERLGSNPGDPPIPLNPECDVSYLFGSGSEFPQAFTLLDGASQDGHSHVVFGTGATLEVPNGLGGTTTFNFPVSGSGTPASIVLMWDPEGGSGGCYYQVGLPNNVT